MVYSVEFGCPSCVHNKAAAASHRTVVSKRGSNLSLAQNMELCVSPEYDRAQAKVLRAEAQIAAGREQGCPTHASWLGSQSEGDSAMQYHHHRQADTVDKVAVTIHSSRRCAQARATTANGAGILSRSPGGAEYRIGSASVKIVANQILFPSVLPPRNRSLNC